MRVATSTIGVDKTTSTVATNVKDEKHFSRRSFIVVLFTTLLLLFGFGFKAYRFTLPTEGWSLQLDFGKGLIFDQNLLGVSSPLQQGDILLNVAGESMEFFDPFALPTPEAQAAFRVGNTVQYQVQRGDETLSFDVPLYSWTAAGIAKAFWQVVLNRVSQFSVFTLLQLAVALFVFIKRPNNLAAQLLLLMNVGSVVSGVNWVGAVVFPGDALDPVARVTSYLFGLAINPVLLVPLFLHLALIFPKPKWGFQKSIWPVTLLYSLPLLLNALRDAHLIPNISDALVPFYFLLIIVAFIYSFVTIKDIEQRAQIKWVIYGGAVQALGSALWVASNILQWLPQSVFTYLQWLPWDFILPLCLAIAILQYRLFDIDVIINRTLVYGTLSLGVAGLYLGLVTGSSYLLQSQPNAAVSLVAIALILFLLRPFYQILQSNVNRFIPVTPMNYMMSDASSEFTASHDSVENFSPQTDIKEKKSSRSTRLVIIFAIALISFSVVQKAYRFTLPSEGWSTTTDFESDEPIFVKNLLGTPSELQAGDRLIAVNGVPVEDTMLQATRGKTTRLESYQVGQTVTYRIVREGKELDVNVPLYAGTRLGLGSIIWQFFSSEGLSDWLVWSGVVIAAFIFWKRPTNLTAQLLFLQTISRVASGISWTVTPLSFADALSPATFYPAAFFSHWIHAVLDIPLGLHLILSFPKPSPILQKRWTLPLLYGFPFLIVVLSLTILPEYSPFMVVVLYNLLGIIAAVRLFFSVRDPVETAQVRWFVFGFGVSNLGLVLFGLSVAGILPQVAWAESIPLDPILSFIYLVCIAVALLRYRLFDINVIINRTLVYGGLTLSVISLYVLVVGGLGRLIQTQGNLTLSLFATGLVAVVFQPLRQRLQKGANRLLYGERDDPYKVLSKLSERMEGTVEPSKLLPTMTETIAQTLKLPFAAIALGQNNNMQIVASHGAAKSASVTLPLAYQGETVGELRLEPRAGETFKQSELNLLKTIAQQASVAAHTVKQHLDLQHSREALVTAREEERLRIRRDLHDGLGPELASLTLKLDATRNLLKHDADKAETLLVELKHQTQYAVASIRRLVYALRPPALDELGLEGALREQARSYGHVLNIDLKTVGDLTNLPAATEVACYRITQEALTNVVRHSRAKHCTIILCTADKLFIDVQDNGIGLSEHYRSGVGLRSMRERAEELGGTFIITSSEKGTRLVATLPLMGKE